MDFLTVLSSNVQFFPSVVFQSLLLLSSLSFSFLILIFFLFLHFRIFPPSRLVFHATSGGMVSFLLFDWVIKSLCNYCVL